MNRDSLQGAWIPHMYGTTRPDLWEVFGGHAEISWQGSRAGLLVMQPLDVLWGCDLRDEKQRSEALRLQRTHRPRLVVIQFPCKVWSQLANLNYCTAGQRNELDELRRNDLVFVELAVQMAQIQKENGDYFIIENPATSAARKTQPILELVAQDGVHEVIGHMCRYGLEHPVCGLPIRKPTWWVTNSDHLAHQL